MSNIADLEKELEKLQSALSKLCTQLQVLSEKHDNTYDKIEMLTKNIEKIELRIEKIFEIMGKTNENNDEKFATKESIEPMRLFIYGMIGTIVLGVMYALLKLVFIQ